MVKFTRKVQGAIEEEVRFLQSVAGVRCPALSSFFRIALGGDVGEVLNYL